MPFRNPDPSIGDAAATEAPPAEHILSQLVGQLKPNMAVVHPDQQEAAGKISERIDKLQAAVAEQLMDDAIDLSASVESLRKQKLGREEASVELARTAIEIAGDVVKLWIDSEESYVGYAESLVAEESKAKKKAARALVSLGFDRDAGPAIQVESRKPGVNIKTVQHQFDFFVRFAPIVKEIADAVQNSERQAGNARRAKAAANEITAALQDQLRSQLKWLKESLV